MNVKNILIAVLLVMMSLGGCMSGPKGVLGVQWGEDAVQVAARLGVPCSSWRAWEEGFEICSDSNRTIDAFGSHAAIDLIRKEGRLEGIQLFFLDTSWLSLRDRITHELELKRHSLDAPHPYLTWSNGALVRVDLAKTGSGFTLTVAGPRFGAFYSTYLQRQGLREGLNSLVNGMRPH